MSVDTIGRLRGVEQLVNNLGEDVSRLKGQTEVLEKRKGEIESRLAEMKAEEELYLKATELLTVAQEAVRQGIKKSFEDIITFALQFILGSDYAFDMEFGRRGNLQEVDFKVRNMNLKEPADPIETSGGGVVDIMSLALRVAILELHKPRIDGPLVLDESFKHLSRQHLYAAGAFLKALTQRINRQIIMVSHKSEFEEMADNGIRIGDGK